MQEVDDRHHWYTWFRELDSPTDVDSLLERLTGTRLVNIEPPPSDEAAVIHAVDSCNTGVYRRALAACSARARMPFVEAALALILPSLEHLERAIGTSRLIAEPRSFFEGLVRALMAKLQQVTLRSQVALMHDCLATEPLPTLTPEARFDLFEQRLAGELGSLFAAQYPVSVTQARGMAAAWVRQIEQIMTRLEADWTDITSLGPSIGSRLTDVRVSLGDSHRGGQSVCILAFSDGSHVVYKPRNLAIDAAYRSLVERIGATTPRLCLAAPRVLPRRDYGWVEYVGTEPSDSAPEPSQLYLHIGQLMGLLHVLRANDLHYENFLVLNGRPALVDVETILGAVPPRRVGADDRAALALANTVQTTGMLPTMLDHPGKDLPGIDIGALGYREGQVSPFTTMVVIDPFTDRMRFELQHLPSDQASPFPVLESPKVEIAAIVEGYREFYSWAMAHRRELAQWISELFGDVTIRFVALNTQRYAQLLRLATNPAIQRAPAAQWAVLHRVAIARPYVPDEILRSEVAQLHRGDVPYFCLRSGERHIFDDAGALCVDDALATTPLGHVLRGVEQLSAAGLERNVWIIRMSYIARLSRVADLTGFDPTAAPTPRHHDGNRASPRKVALTLSARIGQRLEAARIPASGTLPATWIGAQVSPTAYQYWKVDELAFDVYSGSAGLARTLAQIGVAADRPGWRAAALSFFVPTARGLLRHTDGWVGLRRGCFTGLESFLVAAFDVAELLGDVELTDLAITLWERLPTLLTGRQAQDVTFGTAGVLSASAALAGRPSLTAHRDLFADVASAAFARLRQDLFDEGTDQLPGGNPLKYSGFAHGNAGVYVSLAQYGGLVGHEVTASLVDQLLEHEESFRIPAGEGWRFGSPDTVTARGWCHGAPGLLLAKTLVCQADPRRIDQLADDCATLIRLTRETAFGNNLSLCHGDLGNLSILADVAKLTGNQELAQFTDEAMDRYTLEILPAQLENHLSRHSINHSLMLGQSGAASVLLRHYTDIAVRPVLWFAS